jgi:hypothetical protein
MGPDVVGDVVQSLQEGFVGRSYWIPGSWHLRIVYTGALSCPVP